MTGKSITAYHSIEICYELSKESLERLVARKDVLDGKALALLGGASGLITFVPALAKTWVEQPVTWKNIPFFLAIVFFVSAVYFLLKAYWPKGMISTYDPKPLLDEFAPLGKEECQIRLLERFAEYFDYNYNILYDMLVDLKWGFRLVIAEIGFLIFRLFLG